MRVWQPIGVGIVGSLLLAVWVGCAKKDETPPTRVASVKSPKLAPASATAGNDPKVTTEIPTACASRDVEVGEGGPDPCFPPQAFVKALCRGKYPGVALTMFREGTPWRHAWVKIPEVMPQNPYQGPVTHAPLLFSEEVVLLRFHPFVPIEGYSGMGPDRYDVLRLSGSCASLAVDEIRYRWRGPSRYAPLVWNWLDPELQRALARSDEVGKAKDGQHRACAGRYLGGGDSGCQEATDGLALAIMKQVDAGIDLPTPKKLPRWAVE